MAGVTVNDLLDALLASRTPQRPGPEWVTVRELVEGALAKGVKMSESSMKRQLRREELAGRAERQEVAGARGGLIAYWRLTNGHRPPD